VGSQQADSVGVESINRPFDFSECLRLGMPGAQLVANLTQGNNVPKLRRHPQSLEQVDRQCLPGGGRLWIGFDPDQVQELSDPIEEIIGQKWLADESIASGGESLSGIVPED
jgi:hypothetical protein